LSACDKNVNPIQPKRGDSNKEKHNRRLVRKVVFAYWCSQDTSLLFYTAVYMGLFDFITNIFSKSDKAKPKKKKAGSKAATKSAPKKKSAAKSKKTNKGELKTAKKKKPQKKSKSSGILPFSLDKTKGKKRKKSKQISADPIDAQALGFSISLKDEDEHAKKRQAVRINVDGLEAHVHRLKKKYDVTDISATGLGFAFEKPRVKSGVKLKMDLYLDGKLKTKGLMCKVMRHARGSVGCIFMDLDRAQDDAVHEVVLLGQKQQSARKNKAKDRDFKLPE